MSKNLELRDTVEFVWMYSDKFFVMGRKGNFVFSSPKYGGDNTIKPIDKNYGDFCDSEGFEHGCPKGFHQIGSFCGREVNIENLQAAVGK